MNIGQLARNQQMMYRFISRSTNSGYQAQMKSQLSSFGGLDLTAKSDSTSELLQSMGISGLGSGTARAMAQYQMRLQNAASGTSAAQAAQASSAANAATQAKQFSVREQYTPISDKATEAMQQLALEDAKNSIGTPKADSEARAKLIQQQLKDVDPSKRTAAFNTMNKVWENEMDRLGNYIKEKDSNWNDWGDKFDTAILNDYKPGVNVWV